MGVVTTWHKAHVSTMKKTRKVRISESLSIGGGAPVSVQTMWKSPLAGAPQTKVLQDIRSLAAIGCDTIRFSVPTTEEAQALIKLACRSPIPLVADIHFDHTLALACIEGGVKKVRINPGNIGSAQKVKEVIHAAQHHGTAIRVGVNGGSLPAALRKHPNQAEAMVLAAEEELNILEQLGFSRVIFSLKSSHVQTTCKANRLFSEQYDYPLHVGVTEAGPLEQGLVKSSVAMGLLLSQGIGDTIRVSLSDSMQQEVVAGVRILQALDMRKQGVEIISCPHCGRASFQKERFLDLVQKHTQGVSTPLKIAVMGCVVNGPNEAKDADLGVTGSSLGKVVFFQKGKQVAAVSETQAEATLLKILKELLP